MAVADDETENYSTTAESRSATSAEMVPEGVAEQ